MVPFSVKFEVGNINRLIELQWPVKVRKNYAIAGWFPFQGIRHDIDGHRQEDKAGDAGKMYRRRFFYLIRC